MRFERFDEHERSMAHKEGPLDEMSLGLIKRHLYELTPEGGNCHQISNALTVLYNGLDSIETCLKLKGADEETIRNFNYCEAKDLFPDECEMIERNYGKFKKRIEDLKKKNNQFKDER